MIYTVTLNPSLDYFAAADGMLKGRTNRTHDEYIVPGGKGLNVSMVLAELGTESTAFGFSAGFTGRELQSLLEKRRVLTELIEVPQGFTRINVKINTGEITEFNGAGIELSESLLETLKMRLSGLSEEDLIVFSGAVPKGAEKTLYRSLMAACPAQAVLDTFGEALASALPERPFLIKPNAEEIEYFAGHPVSEGEELKYEMNRLQDLGARNVLVSLGGRGAVLLTEEGSFFAGETPAVPEGRPFNTVAAGDSMIAGFLHEWLRSGDYEKALRFAVCVGTAAAYSSWLPEKEFIGELWKG